MKIFKQLLIILVINFTGELISETLSVPLPGSIIGMLILLALLLMGIVKEEYIIETATFLLDNMPFFFIPAGVSVMVSYQFLEGHLVATISTIVLSTLLVMIVTGLVTQFLIKSKKDD